MTRTHTSVSGRFPLAILFFLLLFTFSLYYSVQFHLISNGGQRVVLVFNKVHCLAHKNLPPATFYLRSPAKAGIQNAGSRRIIRTSFPLDLWVKPEDDRGA